MLVCTFDLEPWWVLVPPTVLRSDWKHLPDRSEEPLRRFLDLCDESESKATFFVVGEYARRFPARVRGIVDRGHQLGCHSLFHDDLATQNLETVRRETEEAKAIIEDAGGIRVEAFRAPSFSVPLQRLPDFFGILAQIGFTIDSSLSSAVRVYGGAQSLGDVGRIFSLKERFGVEMHEVGVPGVPLFGRELTVFGGGYLRLTPTAAALGALRRSFYNVLYLHAHDFDPDCPRVPGSSAAQHLRRRLRFGDLYARVRALLNEKRGFHCGEAVAATLSS